ncbi:MAG TPA: cache domain-containing protein [Desulfuromonadales bacterium]|nr:cache domain-containing protein [Desulfuromonadales bacterium]
MRRLSLSPISIRGKLTLAALTPLLLVLMLVSIAVFYLINAWIVDEAQKRVRRHLHAAREVLRQEERHLREVVRLAAGSPALAEAAERGDTRLMEQELTSLRQREGLDILTLTDPRGEVLRRGANPGRPGGEPAPVALARALLAGESPGGLLLLTAEELRREGEELAGRARIPLRLPHPADREPVETRGLLLVGAAPLTATDGRLLGYIYGGTLLNGNLPLVDRIQEIIYGGETHQGTESGSATIFLDRLRVATTVRLKDGERAVGTLVSPQVAEAVLTMRQLWVDRALVVDQWYLSAYEPLLDTQGEAVGALYVGLLERPYTILKTRAGLLLIGLLLLGGGLGYLIARTISQRLSRPIRELEATASRVAGGEREIRLPVTTRDEVGHLTEAFNRMTAALTEREEELSRLNRELEHKVEERTALLEEKSLQLIHTQEELARAEKLAAIGSLAAGVAHEINNPAAIIRGNVEILLMNLPAEVPGQEEAEEILRQTERIALITQNMLAFARKQSLHQNLLRLNSLIEEILAQAGHLVPLEQMRIERHFDPQLPLIEGDAERLRQVFTNIIVNALQAMAGNGTLTVTTRLEGAVIEIALADTGPGIPREIRDKIFDPFFTTRVSGSGLGLSVSYGIVQAHGGSITVESEKGLGSIFRVRLPQRRAQV